MLLPRHHTCIFFRCKAPSLFSLAQQLRFFRSGTVFLTLPLPSLLRGKAQLTLFAQLLILLAPQLVFLRLGGCFRCGNCRNIVNVWYGRPPPSP